MKHKSNTINIFGKTGKIFFSLFLLTKQEEITLSNYLQEIEILLLPNICRYRHVLVTRHRVWTGSWIY
jgi:hypothetical protein